MSTPTRSGAAVVLFALACGGFAIGTGEFAIMALLPQIARSFAASVPTAGHAITAYAVGVVVGAPLFAIAGARSSRRNLLLVLMAVFAIFNLASAAAPDIRSLVLLRFVSGLPHGAYFGVAALVAASLVPTARRTRAVGRVMLGLTSATLVGTPAMAILGEWSNWRVLFAVVGAAATLTTAALWRHLPVDRGPADTDIVGEIVAFTRPQVLITLAMAACGFGGMFSIVSYIAATATEYAHLPVTMVAVLMVLFGVGMNAGNVVGSRLADRSLMGTIGGMWIFNIVTMTAFGLFANQPVALCVTTVLAGASFAAAPAIQSRLMDVAREGQALAAASLHSAFNIANAAGAWLGGRVIELGFGYPATGYVGAALSALGLVAFAVSVGLDRRGAVRR